MRVFWIIILVLLILLLVVMGMYLLIGSITHNLVLSRKGKVKCTVERNYSNHLQGLNIDESYFDNDFETINILSEDKLNLFGFYKSKGNDKLAILAHGYGADHKEMANYAKYFESRGYDILAIDHRCHGKSEGNDLTMGVKESQDLLLWINKVLEINPRYKIVLFGHSMGASTVCLTVGKNIPSNVILAIEDCGYSNADDQFKFVYLKRKIHPKLMYKIFYNYTKKTYGFNFKDADAVAGLKKSKIPILFIHGDQDNFVPTEMVYKLFDAVSEEKRDIYIAENAGHVASYSINRKKYEQKVDKFLLKYNM